MNLGSVEDRRTHRMVLPVFVPRRRYPKGADGIADHYLLIAA